MNSKEMDLWLQGKNSVPYGGLSYNCTYFYDIAQSVRDAMQGNTVNDYTDYCNTFTGEMHSAKFGTKCLLQMLLIAEIKSLLVNKKILENC